MNKEDIKLITFLYIATFPFLFLIFSEIGIDDNNLFLLVSLVSFLFAIIVQKLNVNKKSWFIILYFIPFVIGIIYLKFYKAETKTEYSIKGVWETKESDGEDFKLEVSGDSTLVMIDNSGDLGFYTYSYKKNELLLFNQGKLLYAYEVVLKDSSMTLSLSGDNLLFYRKE